VEGERAEVAKRAQAELRRAHGVKVRLVKKM